MGTEGFKGALLSALIIALFFLYVSPVARAQFEVSPPGFAEENVPLGYDYCLETRLAVWNRDNIKRLFSIYTVTPPENMVGEGFEPIPDNSWLFIVDGFVEIENNSSKSVELWVNIPRWENLTNKRWEAWIRVERMAEPGEVVSQRVDVVARLVTATELPGTPPLGCGNLVIVQSVDANILDVHRTKLDWAYQAIALTYDTLMTFDDNMQYIPLLAESWEIDNEGLFIDYHLRRDVKFHCGEPFNADAVVYSIRRVKEPWSAHADSVKNILDAEALDEYTVRIHLKQWDRWLYDWFATTSSSIVCPRCAEEHGLDYGEEYFCGTGPFKVKEWIREDRLILERNEDYTWGPEIYQNRGPAHLEGITFEVIPTDISREEKFKEGEADMMIGLSPRPTLIDWLNTTENVNFIINPRSSMSYVGFHVGTLSPEILQGIESGTPYPSGARDSPVSDDPEGKGLLVRKALLYATHRENVFLYAWENMGKVAYGPLTSLMWGYEPLVEDMYPYDPEMARSLLAEAGYADGLSLTILTTNYEPYTKTCEVLKEQWAKVGVTLNIEVRAFDDMESIITNAQHDLWIGGWNWHNADMIWWYWHTARVPPASNRFWWGRAYTDALIENTNSIDDDVAYSAIQESQRLIMEDAAYLPVIERPFLLAHWDRVKGFRMHPLSNSVWKHLDTYIGPSHGPILIVGNDNFTSANGVTSGSGTGDDPYVIENWDISAESAHRIEIRSTTAYFVIRNCYVHDEWVNYKYGIYFDNVMNGKIDNNVAGNNYISIYLYNSNNNLISNNLMENNSIGIQLIGSDNNLISNNLMENNNWSGMYLYFSNNNLISNNLMENNADYGIRLDFSGNNIVTNNIVENNDSIGIYLYNSDNNLISNNLVGNNYSGIPLVSSDNNLIYHNNLISNAIQAYDNGANYWDDGYPSGGNYWSDYTGADTYRGENQDIPGSDGIGDTPYIILGDNNQDRYPLMEPWMVGAPEVIIIVGGKDTAYNINLEAVPPLKSYTSSPPLMAAARVGSGAVVATGTVSTCRDSRWNAGINPDPYFDVLLDKAFQWMTSGKAVLWFEGYGVYNTIDAPEVQCQQLEDALEAKGYTLTGDATTPITSGLLSGYDILVIPQMQLGESHTGGDPALLPDSDVQAIVDFVNGGGGLLIMESSDYAGHNHCKVHNKILTALGVGFYFQDDQVQDDTNQWGQAAFQPIAVVDTTTEIGSAYQSETGTNEIGLYSMCSLRIEVDYEVSVMVSPTINVGGAGEVLTYNATITNIGTKSDTYTLTVEDELGWTVTLSKNEVSLENGESEVVEASVTVPEGLTEKMGNWITLTASGVSEDNARFRAVNVFPLEEPPYPVARPDVTRFLGPGLPTLLVDLPAVPVITAVETGFGMDLTPREPWPILHGEGEFAPVGAAELIGNGRVLALSNSILRDSYFDRAELANYEVMSLVARWMIDWEDPREHSLLYWVTEDSHHLPPGTAAPIVTKYVELLEEDFGFDVGTQVGGEITPGLIAGYDVIQLADILRPLSSEEIQTVVDYVDNGGGLIIMCQADYGGFGRPNYPNELLEALGSGIRFQDDEMYDEDSWVVDGPWYPQVYLLDAREANAEFDVWFPEHDLTISMPVKSMTVESALVVFKLTLTNVGTASTTYTIEVTETSTPENLGWAIEVKPAEIGVAAGENVEICTIVTVPDIEAGRERMDLDIKVTDAVQDYLTKIDSFAVLGEDGRAPTEEAKLEVGQSVSHTDWGEVTIEDAAWDGSAWAYVVETADGELKLAAEEDLNPTSPGQPQLYLPPDGTYTNYNTPTFEWIVGSNADSHRLLVDNDPDFTSPEENVLLGATDSTYTPTAELADENYSWKVIAINAVGENESTVWAFTIDTIAPAAPSPLEPADGSLTNDNTPTFRWTSVTDPSGVTYTIQVDNDSDFTSLEVDVSGLTENSYTFSVLVDENYAWHVRAVDGANNAGDWSTIWTFVIDTVPPSTPALQSPADGTITNDNTPTFDWSDVAGAENYDLLVDNDADFSSPETQVTVTVSTYAPTAGLPDENYSWKARARDAANNLSGWSAVWTFHMAARTQAAEVSIPLAISAFLIGAAILAMTYLLRVRPKKATRRRVLGAAPR